MIKKYKELTMANMKKWDLIRLIKEYETEIDKLEEISLRLSKSTKETNEYIDNYLSQREKYNFKDNVPEILEKVKKVLNNRDKGDGKNE